MNLDAETIALAHRIWDYHHVNHPLHKADCLLVLGSHDPRVAERGAELMLQGYAPLIIFSGGLGRLTEGLWTEPEADRFANIAKGMGVPADQILTENHSTNTGENISLSYQLLQKHGVAVERLILVQKPYMERRALATFEKQWPGEQVEFRVTSPQISFDDYPNEEISLEHVIHIMIGDLQRIRLYPKLGFQTYQEIPPDVEEAYERLVAKGFTSHLMAEA
ncbi:YdcF family protein [soil metagenome]